MADGNRDVPCVVRRRRKLNRQHYGQLAEGSRLGQKCSSDEDENSHGAAEEATREGRGGVSSYRSKILGRRDRKVSNTRSQSTPRVDPANSTVDVASFMRSARRSLSSPRHKDEPLDPHEKDIRVTKKMPTSPSATAKMPMSKVQENLRRFEEERKRLEGERRKFEQEKRDLDRLRVRRLEEHDRKRITEGYNQFKSQIPRLGVKKVAEDKQNLIENFNRAQKMSNQEQLPVEGPQTLVVEKPSQAPQRSHSLREAKRKTSFEPVDFESSTVSCSTTEEDVGDEAEGEPKRMPEKSFIDPKRTLDVEPAKPNGVHAQRKESKDRSPSVQKTTTSKLPTKLELWREFKEAHSEEVERICLLRNRCMSNLIILIIFCGIGGIIFRFVEGAFENFYKCGVKRVKRDFVDQLWHSSHNLRWSNQGAFGE